MSKLKELIKEFCSDGVEYKPICQVAFVRRGTRVVRSQLEKSGAYQVYQNSLKPLGYFDQSNCPAKTVFVIGAGAAGEIGYSGVDFWAADDCYYISHCDNLDSRYLYHVLISQQQLILSKVRKASIPRFSRSVIENLTIPVPPLEVQRKIVCILDNFTELTAELTEELTARKQQYEYYRDELFDENNGMISKAKWQPLGELFPFIRNGFVGTATPYFTNSQDGVRYPRGTNIHNGRIEKNDMVYVTKQFHEKHARNELKADDILMVQSGHVGDCAVVGEEYAGSNCHALIIMSNAGECNSQYIVHYLHSKEGIRGLSAITTGGTVKHILASEIEKVLVPVIPVKEQNWIVNILDNFDCICSNLSSDIPAEIEARQKQYEYYRDKSLSFKEINV